MLHHFIRTVSHIPLPEKFTYPFCYTPHPLCLIAAEELQAYIGTQTQWREELSRGKMFGVLVVRTYTGELGYLAAFSGILAGSNRHPGFVPPIYDLLRPEEFFRKEEDEITAINRRIDRLRTRPEYLRAKELLRSETERSETELAEMKRQMTAAKAERDRRRLVTADEIDLAQMIRESQFQKAEYKRTERAWNQRLSGRKNEIEAYEREIELLCTERKQRSAALQQKLFEHFRLLNAAGEERNLCRIFDEDSGKVPPAGAGECAAPKLLQYAYQQGVHPVAMAEFWWGDSPKTEIRRHGFFYPSCKGKCGPILRFMLQGLAVDPDPLTLPVGTPVALEVVYEDDTLLVVDKPAGLLSVPGKGDADSVYRRVRQKYPEADGPMVVHRLDMDTSGLLVIAKNKNAHQNLQAQFKNRTIRKRYIALLQGVVLSEEGTISLPLCTDPLDRPRQIVNDRYGKPAITRYRVIERGERTTRIAFYPQTGRTHQLRVHAAHPQGLDAPIVGDRLYGIPADRLYLHAECLEFSHPVTGETICVEKKAPF